MRRALAAVHYASYVGSIALLWLVMVTAGAPEPVGTILKALLAVTMLIFGVLGLREVGAL